MESAASETKKTSPNKKMKFVICMFFIMLMVFAFLKVREMSNPGGRGAVSAPGIRDPGRDDPAAPTPTATTTQNQLDRIRIGALVAALISVSPGLPTVEYVSDTLTVKKVNPTFYQNVERGDWVVTYPTLVVIYRPSDNHIVNALPIK